nr:hypothetical protein [Tanacetum cinerariifolium]
SKYVLEILKKYGMESCDPVGNLMGIKDKLYLDQNGTPVDATKYHSMIDVDYAGCKDTFKSTSGGAQFLEILKKYGMESCDPVGNLMGIKDKLDLDQNGTPVDATKYHSMIDFDYAGCKDTFKSTSGGAQFLGKKLVSCSSKKKDCTALSTMEEEYVSLSACFAQALWMRTQLTDYDFHFNKISIYCDSKSAIAISCNPVQHSRTKHIAVPYHFIKEHVEKGSIELYFVKTDYQLADLFTKTLPANCFNNLFRRLGMRSLSP